MNIGITRILRTSGRRFIIQSIALHDLQRFGGDEEEEEGEAWRGEHPRPVVKVPGPAYTFAPSVDAAVATAMKAIVPVDDGPAAMLGMLVPTGGKAMCPLEVAALRITGGWVVTVDREATLCQDGEAFSGRQQTVEAFGAEGELEQFLRDTLAA